MNIFTRIRDIVSSNVNSALDKMEDPQKMINLMITQLSDTLVEARTSLAASIASKSKAEKEQEVVKQGIERWENRANMAVSKGLDDMAREALVEKKDLVQKYEALSKEIATYEAVIASKQEQVAKIEAKLEEMKQKATTMSVRAVSAKEKIKTDKALRESDGADIIRKFQEFETKVDKLEAEAELTSFRGSATTDAKFSAMEKDEAIEKELNALKQSIKENK